MDHLPTAEDIQEFIHNSPAPVNKRDIAKHFKIKGSDRIYLKRTLKELSGTGHIELDHNKSYKPPETLSDVAVVEVVSISDDGEVIAKPAHWYGKDKAPEIYLKPRNSGQKQPDIGARALARMKRLSPHEYLGTIIQLMDDPAKHRMVGTFKTFTEGGGAVTPTDKKDKNEYIVKKEDQNDAENGDLVICELQPKLKRNIGKHHKQNQKLVRIIESLGSQDDPKNISLISIHNHSIPNQFPEKVIIDAEKAEVPPLDKREDLRQVPLVTIDGADARDFDDAVFAEADTDPKNEGGFHIIVAIADVSFYVTPGSPLDVEAYKRGNSTYFPDRVVPMLPEQLSNDICSLRPHEPRACMFAHIWIDKNGQLKRYQFNRGLMQSHARLIYEQVQAAKDGNPDAVTEPLLETVINPLYEAYAVLDKARQERGALDLDLPERQAVINDKGEIEGIIPRERLDSHKLIEEFMILANVAAALTLEDKKSACIYRAHDRPENSRLDDARQFLSQMGYSFAKGAVVQPKDINNILDKARGTETSELVSTIILRSQSQAVYSPDNHGHFGLALRHYAHFTSPIRRYADLIVHRLLTSSHKLGTGGFDNADLGLLPEMAEHISNTERNSMTAERSAMDRYTSLYLSDKIGAEFDGKINGVTRFGLFITLTETGADGIVPIRTLPKDYYIHDEGNHALIGKDNGITYRLSARVRVKLIEANPMTGSTVFALVNAEEGAEIPGFVPKHPVKTNNHSRKGKPHFKKKPKKAKSEQKNTKKKHLNKQNAKKKVKKATKKRKNKPSKRLD